MQKEVVMEVVFKTPTPNQKTSERGLFDIILRVLDSHRVAGKQFIAEAICDELETKGYINERKG